MVSWSTVRSALIAVVIYAIVSTAISLVFFRRLSWDAGSEIGAGLIVLFAAALIALYFERKNTPSGIARRS